MLLMTGRCKKKQVEVVQQIQIVYITKLEYRPPVAVGSKVP